MTRRTLLQWIAQLARRFAAWIEYEGPSPESAAAPEDSIAILRARFPGAPDAWLNWILQRAPHFSTGALPTNQRPGEPMAAPAAHRAKTAEAELPPTAPDPRACAYDDWPTTPDPSRSEAPRYQSDRTAAKHAIRHGEDPENRAGPAVAWEFRPGDPTPRPAAPTAVPPIRASSPRKYRFRIAAMRVAAAPPSAPPPAPPSARPSATRPAPSPGVAEERRAAQNWTHAHRAPRREQPVELEQPHRSPAAAATFPECALPPSAPHVWPDPPGAAAFAGGQPWPVPKQRTVAPRRAIDPPVAHAKGQDRPVFPSDGRAEDALPAFPLGDTTRPPSIVYTPVDDTMRGAAPAYGATESPWPPLPPAWHEPRHRFTPLRDLADLKRQQEETGWSA